jgi:hypothetical protein
MEFLRPLVDSLRREHLRNEAIRRDTHGCRILKNTNYIGESTWKGWQLITGPEREARWKYHTKRWPITC